MLNKKQTRHTNNNTSVLLRNCRECKIPDARFSHKTTIGSIDPNTANTVRPKSPEPSFGISLLRNKPIDIPISSSSASPYNSNIYYGISSPGCDSPTSDSIVNSITWRKFRKYQYKKNKETQLLQRRILELKKEKDSYRKRAERAEKIIGKKKTDVLNSHIAIDQPTKKTLKRGIGKQLRNILINYFEVDENSKICPGKKLCRYQKQTKKKRKRFLTNSLKNWDTKMSCEAFQSIRKLCTQLI